VLVVQALAVERAADPCWVAMAVDSAAVAQVEVQAVPAQETVAQVVTGPEETALAARGREETGPMHRETMGPERTTLPHAVGRWSGLPSDRPLQGHSPRNAVQRIGEGARQGP
jgi:hypothetical protein